MRMNEINNNNVEMSTTILYNTTKEIKKKLPSMLFWKQ